VLLNLYSNALKFTDRDGRITIKVENQDPYLKVGLIDSGLGIKDEDRCKIFKLFSSFRDNARKINTKGIGLGLVICKKIVEKFNGVIDFDSVYGQGSTFHFTFEKMPFDESAWRREQRSLLPSLKKPKRASMFTRAVSPAHQASSPCLKRLVQFKNRRILVADDEEFCIASMKAILE